MTGGPYQHRIRAGRCRVCGYVLRISWPTPGCPWDVDMKTLKSGIPLSSGEDAARAYQELRVLLAAKEEDTG